MDIKRYQKSDRHRLFEYWQRVGAHVPYFFPVSVERWQTCLLEDELDGERIFRSLETYFAVESDQVLGFVQYGEPNFAWDASGKYYDPHIGVIRHLYFEAERQDVGKVLMGIAADYLVRFHQNHAFYHILGMSCNAYHGKLHSSQFHVEQQLQAHGFSTEHENIYYGLDMMRIKPTDSSELHLKSTLGEIEESFEVELNGEAIGTVQVKYLDTLTDDHTRETAYLSWIGVHEPYRGKGLGTAFLQLLVDFLINKGYRYLHTDTAGDNLRAQRFYEKHRFERRGCTKSYVRTG